ncbi:MAG: TetR family transcriptional regulator [Cyclobacteriaceae bacterium]|jgi:AcrR family transcriptional regulator|nr:TetR family transcriptional regulator [Cyclobacteriaceae bacterium]
MGRTSLKEIRQREIILAFYTVSKKIGLENASLARVASHMGINPSLIAHYFKTREALFAGLIAFTLERYRDMYNINGGEFTTAAQLRKLIDNLFSRRWNKLVDDGVFYSCYAYTYRQRKIKTAFRALHDSLRAMLVDALKKARSNGVIRIRNEEETAEIIFALIEGAYYYLGMVESKAAYDKKLRILKKQAIGLLGL